MGSLAATFCAVVFLAVVARYFGLAGLLVLADLQLFLFSALFFAGILLAYANDRHVGLQVIADTNRPLRRRLVFRLWTLAALVLPFALLLVVSIPQAVSSFQSLESATF